LREEFRPKRYAYNPQKEPHERETLRVRKLIKTFSQITPLINHKRRIHGIDQTKEKTIEPSIFIPPIEGLTEENIQESIVYISQLESLPEAQESESTSFLENLTETTTIST
jgi:hypothetical protein